jgi:hypothetical protein
MAASAVVALLLSILMSLLLSLLTFIIVLSGYFSLDTTSSLLTVEITHVDATLVVLDCWEKHKCGHLEEKNGALNIYEVVL